jgi:hypothetical protein
MPTAAIAAPKISFEKVDMIFASASGSTTMGFVVDAQKLGLRGRTFHHSLLENSAEQYCAIACEALLPAEEKGGVQLPLVS